MHAAREKNVKRRPFILVKSLNGAMLCLQLGMRCLPKSFQQQRQANRKKRAQIKRATKIQKTAMICRTISMIWGISPEGLVEWTAQALWPTPMSADSYPAGPIALRKLSIRGGLTIQATVRH